MSGEKDFERRLERIERGVLEIDGAADAGLRATAQQLVQSILELHAAGLERLLEIVHGSGEAGQAIIDQLGRDAMVSKLLLLHSLHPLSIEARVGKVIDDLRVSLREHHADVELVAIVDGTVRVRVAGGAKDKATVERAILDAAPDVTALEVDGGTGGDAVAGFVALDSLRAAAKRPPATAALVAALEN